MPTTNLTQLKQALVIAEKIDALQAELAGVLGGGSTVASIIKAPSTPVVKKGKRTMSAAARARIAAAQKARWAKAKGETVVDAAEAAVALVTPKAKKKAKRTISPEARAKMAEAAKKRWAKVKNP